MSNNQPIATRDSQYKPVYLDDNLNIITRERYIKLLYRDFRKAVKEMNARASEFLPGSDVLFNRAVDRVRHLKHRICDIENIEVPTQKTDEIPF